MRPSASWMTTPYSRVSGTFLTVSVAIPPADLVALDQLAQVDVGERVSRDDHDRVVAEEVGDVANAAGGTEQLLLVAPGQRCRRSSS